MVVPLILRYTVLCLAGFGNLPGDMVCSLIILIVVVTFEVADNSCLLSCNSPMSSKSLCLVVCIGFSSFYPLMLSPEKSCRCYLVKFFSSR